MGRFQKASQAAVLEGEKSLTFALTVPEKAKRKKNEPRDARWSANVQITEVSTEETTSKAGDDHLVFIVDTLIQDGLDDAGTNLGRKVSMKVRYNYLAFNAGDRKDKQYKMHVRSLGVLSQLLRAAGLYAGGDIEEELYETAFPEEGISPLVGQTLAAEIHQAPNDEGKEFPEISAWLVPDATAGGEVLAGAGATPQVAGTVTL